jgi:hypothetical protein
LTEDTGDLPRRRPGREGLASRDGLTNGEVAMEGLDVGTGLINGLGNGGERPRTKVLPLLGASKRKRRAVRETLERKAKAPLPGTDGE